MEIDLASATEIIKVLKSTGILSLSLALFVETLLIFWLYRMVLSKDRQNEALVHEFFSNNTTMVRLMTLLERMVK